MFAVLLREQMPEFGQAPEMIDADLGRISYWSEIPRAPPQHCLPLPAAFARRRHTRHEARKWRQERLFVVLRVDIARMGICAAVPQDFRQPLRLFA
jgi:hypothetical protein